MGFPSTWKPYVGASLLLSNTSTGTEVGGQGLIGIHKELMNPMIGGPALRGEAYLGGTSAGVNGGGRLLLAIPVIWVAGGVDYSLSLDQTDFILSFMAPTTRGGYFHRGTELRLDWLPGTESELRDRPPDADLPAAHRQDPAVFRRGPSAPTDQGHEAGS